MQQIQIAYQSDFDFRTYVDAYAKGRGITAEEALSHKIVELVYQERQKGIGPSTPWVRG